MHWKTEPIRRHRRLPVLRILWSAVSYRIPRPVVSVSRYGEDVMYSVCPRCDSGLEREYSTFCDRCGQRLGWYALGYARMVDSDAEKRLAKSEETGKIAQLWL